MSARECVGRAIFGSRVIRDGEVEARKKIATISLGEGLTI